MSDPKIAPAPRRKASKDILVVVHPQADLLEVVGTLGAVGGFAHFLHGRQQERDEDADDGDDDEQFDQRETTAPRRALGTPRAHRAIQKSLRHGVDPRKKDK